MKRTQIKDALRNIWKQKVSYLSIIVIAFLGVTTFLGIDYSDGALRRNGSIMYNEAHFRDIEIVSTMLLSEEDLELIGKTEGVRTAVPVWQTDAKVSSGATRQNASVITIPQGLNLPQLVEGRLPLSREECAVEQGLAEEMNWQIGDVIETKDAKGNAPKYLLQDRFVISGIVNHPDHTSVSIPDTLYILVLEDAFDKEALDGCFMKAELEIKKPANIDRFSKSYKTAVDTVTERLERLAEERAGGRDSEVRTQYQTEIDKNQEALDEGWQKLQDARTELDDGWKAYTEGKQEFADAQQKLKDSGQQLADAREALDEGGQLLAEGRDKLDSASSQLQSAYGELLEGENQLAEGKVKLTDSKKQLDALKQQLAEGKTRLESAQGELATAKAVLDEGGAQLIAGQQQLTSAREELTKGWNAIEDAKEQIRKELRIKVENNFGAEFADSIHWASRKELNLNDSSTTAMDFWITEEYKFDLSKSIRENLEEFMANNDVPDFVLVACYEKLTGETGEVDKEKFYEAVSEYVVSELKAKGVDYEAFVDVCAKWDEGFHAYLTGLSQYESGYARYQEGWAAYETGLRQYEAGQKEYESGLALYEEGLEAYNTGLAEYEKASKALSEGWTKYNTGSDEYQNGLQEYLNKQAEYDSKLAQYQEGLEAYEQGLETLEDARKELRESGKKLDDGEEQYESGLAEYQDASTQLAEAQEELDNLSPCRWIILSCYGNSSFVQLYLGSSNLASLEMTFSMLFVLVGALVIYATISKIIDEQRNLVGAGKALGLYNREIFAKYLLFGVSATLIGTVLGILTARFWMEVYVLENANPFYTFDTSTPTLIVKPTVIALLAGVLLSVASIWFASKKLLRSTAIELMQPRVPQGRKKARKSERQVLSLYTRLILLNMRTDIRRVLVTIISVAGCCALVVIGFTLKSGVEGALEKQYTKIVDYDGRIRFDSAEAENAAETIEQALRRQNIDYTELYDGVVSFRITENLVGELLCGDLSEITGYYHLRDWKTDEPLMPTDDGILIQKRTAESYNLRVGSELELSLGGTQTVTVKVAGIFDNYIGRVMLMSRAYYRVRKLPDLSYGVLEGSVAVDHYLYVLACGSS